MEKRQINKVELINRVAELTGAGQRTSRKVINTFLEEVAKELQQNNIVMLDSFGKFYTTETKPRTLTTKSYEDSYKNTYSKTYRIGFRPSKKIKQKNQNKVESIKVEESAEEERTK